MSRPVASVSLPTRISACTYNIWTTTRWPERREALASFGRGVAPDILCLQEVQPDSLETLDLVMPAHLRIHDPFEGWAHEGNIYWRNDIFDLDSYGMEDIGILEPLRRLFWVRLRLRGAADATLLVATAHFTWHGHAVARATSRNVRIAQARAAVDALDGLGRRNEAILFTGDFNDSTEPIRVIRESGFEDCFSALGQSSAFTHPAAPTATGVPATLDWLMSRGPIHPVLAHVLDFFLADLAPSDHKPVMAVYELG